MSFSETIFLFVLALIIFGPKKLPEIARQVGKYLNEFKRASNEFRSQIEQEIAHLEVENKQTILPPAEPPAGATSRATYAAKELEASPQTTSLESGAIENPASGTPTNGTSALAVATSEAAVAAHEPSEEITGSDPASMAATAESHSLDSHSHDSELAETHSSKIHSSESHA